VFLQLSWIGLFATKWAIVHIENCDLLELFLPKITQFSQGSNVLDAAAFSIDGFLWRWTYISSTQVNCLFGTKWAFLHLENYDLLGELLSKTNSSLQGNKAQDSAPSHIDGFFEEMHVFLQVSCIGLFGGNRPYLHFNPKLQEVFLLKTTSVLTGKQCVWCPCF
jgi:hypothetical protein